MMHGNQKAINEGNIYPERGRKCDSCDMNLACEKKLYEVEKGELIDKGGQLHFDFAVPYFARKKEEKPKQEAEQLKLRMRLKK